MKLLSASLISAAISIVLGTTLLFMGLCAWELVSASLIVKGADLPFIGISFMFCGMLPAFCLGSLGIALQDACDRREEQERYARNAKRIAPLLIPPLFRRFPISENSF